MTTETTTTAPQWFAHRLDNPPRVKVQRGARDDWEIGLRIDAGHSVAPDAPRARTPIRATEAPLRSRHARY